MISGSGHSTTTYFYLDMDKCTKLWNESNWVSGSLDMFSHHLIPLSIAVLKPQQSLKSITCFCYFALWELCPIPNPTINSLHNDPQMQTGIKRQCCSEVRTSIPYLPYSKHLGKANNNDYDHCNHYTTIFHIYKACFLNPTSASSVVGAILTLAEWWQHKRSYFLLDHSHAFTQLPIK